LFFAESIEDGWAMRRWGLAEQVLDARYDLLFRLYADQAVYLTAVCKKDQGGDASDLELRRYARIFICVEFGNPYSSRKFAR
jgi:hypothetical protein